MLIAMPSVCFTNLFAQIPFEKFNHLISACCAKMQILFQGGVYKDFTEFYSDMHLIKSNCYTYNPAEHMARKVG